MAEMKQFLVIFCIVVCVIGIVLAIALPIASVKTLQATEVGLDYGGTKVEIDNTTLYTAGRHFIGLTHSFIVFPTSLQDISYTSNSTYGSLTARTNDGLLITIDLSFQFSLQQNIDTIVSLYYSFATDYSYAFALIGRNVLRDSVSEFQAFDLVYDRSTVEDQMEQDITDSLSKYGAEVQNFQLLDIEFPQNFTQSINDAQNAILQITTSTNSQTKVSQDAQNAVAQATQQAAAVLNGYLSTAITINNSAVGYVSSISTRLSNLQTNLAYIQGNLSLTSTQVADFQWISSVGTLLQNGGVTVNLGIPATISCFNTGTC